MKWTSLAFSTLMLAAHVNASPIKIHEAWNEISNPEIMGPFFLRKFSTLPLSGKVFSKARYWSGDYWALQKGSINYRWYSRDKKGFNLNSPTKEKARKMSIPELAALSPSEKYDLFTGRYDYPLRNEVAEIANPEAEIWEGMCHGWSPASMNHDEPTPKLMRNPDGIEIPFGSTDIKALISYYYAYHFKAPDTHQMGRRCFKGPFLNRESDCINDLNAGAFHLVLANRLGFDGKGLIADFQRFKEVWNHPITAYEAVITGRSSPGNNAAPGTVEEIQMKTKITYLDDNGNDWHPVIGTPKQAYKTVTYFYDLELDQEGNIIGGDWASKDRPDFLWLMHKPRKFEGILYRLFDLLNDD